jgi:hypothetical protein
MGRIEQKRAYLLSKLAETDYAIDAKTFSIILDLDDDEDKNFSRSLVFDFIQLANVALDDMDAFLCVYSDRSKKTTSDHRDSRAQKAFKQLGDKAGFLRGPCNSLGVYKMEGICARIEQSTTGSTRSTQCDTAGCLMKEARQRLWEAKKAFYQIY